MIDPANVSVEHARLILSMAENKARMSDLHEHMMRFLGSTPEGQMLLDDMSACERRGTELRLALTTFKP